MPSCPDRYFEPHWPQVFDHWLGAAPLPDGVAVTVADGEGHPATVTVRWCADGGVHWRIGAAPVRPYSLLTAAPRYIAASFEEDADGVWCRSVHGAVRLDRTGPFFTLYGADGRARFTTFPLQSGGFDSTVDRTLGVDPGRLAWIDLPLQPGEALWGLGEQFGSLNHRGRSLTLWAEDAFGLPAHETYIPVPLALSSRGYGVFLPTAAPTRWDVGESLPGRMRILLSEPFFEAYLWCGSPAEILTRYQALTGPAAAPPAWSYGVWMSRWGYRTQDELLEVAHQLREHAVPVEVLHLDPYWLTEKNGHTCPFEWDHDSFPDPRGMIRELTALGFRLSLWINPFLPRGSRVYEEARAAGFLVTTEAGAPARVPRFDDESGMVDFTNPAAQTWYQNQLAPLLEMGVSVFKSDFGETAPFEDVRYHNGMAGRAGHNWNALLYQQSVHRATRAARADAMVWGRSGYAGSQRFPVQWGGDSGVTYEYMATSLRGALSYGLSGGIFTAFDGGGFLGAPTPAVYMRWAAMALLFSHTRFHGTTPREPWAFGPEAEAVVRRFADLRYQLLPYLWEQAERSLAQHLPLARPLLLMDPGDRQTWSVDDVYALGDNLVVAPLFNDAGDRAFYLPAGRWHDWFHPDRPALAGARWHEAHGVPLSEILLFQRAGTAIPMYPEGLVQVPDPSRPPARYRIAPPAAPRARIDTGDLSAAFDHGHWVLTAARDVSVVLAGRVELKLSAGVPVRAPEPH